VPWRAARSLLGIVAIVSVLVGVLRAHASSLAASAGRLEVSGELAHALAWRMALFGLAAFGLLAAIDWVASRLIWLSGLRMTRHEVERERREAEGDPRFKQARRRAHAELVQKAAVSELASAAAVVEGHDLAVALAYDGSKDLAPRVLSVARGDQARQMLSHTAKLGIFVQRNEGLTRSLASVGEGALIPERLYDEVAELLAAAASSRARES
jgi:flagellar biosynthesis protein FlhB